MLAIVDFAAIDVRSTCHLTLQIAIGVRVEWAIPPRAPSMNRLQSELHRLYHAPPTPAGQPSGMVRALVMELTQPPSWEVLSAVWQGVRTELELPAPAIAVSGVDALQLWFSLAEPIPAARALAFLEGLRARFLPDIAPARLRLMPARPLPPHEVQTGHWSAFLAPDLAPVFADTPWLDVPPNEEGQAALLHGLAVLGPADFEAALKRLAPRLPQPEQPQQPHSADTSTAGQSPKQFLLRIMNDDAVPLALRIDAAKALLQHAPEH